MVCEGTDHGFIIYQSDIYLWWSVRTQTTYNTDHGRHIDYGQTGD